MIYFHSITVKISRLAQDVSAVYEVDNSHEIRTEEGNHELAILTKNIEYMRASMVSSLEKEKQALDANAELITSMSHDIRTPLTVLLGYLDVMKTVNEDERLSEYINASEATALKLKEISDDMFRYFLVFSGNDIGAEIVSYGAKTLLDQLLAEHVLLLREKGYEVNIQTGSAVTDEILVLTDAPKIMRVIDNLFSNIYKYADPERRITVSTAMARGRLNVIIKNYVSENASHAESTGVGLKTCRKICESIGVRFGTETMGSRGSKVFCARMELPIDDGKKEDKGDEA
jgi:signal transduction histidine kinase